MFIRGVHPTRATRKKIRAAIHQGNWKAVAGLKEWEKCKLPVSERRMEKLPNAYTPLSLKQTSCSLCGEGQLVWGKSIHEKIRLINVYSKSPHRCAQSGNFLSQEELADALIGIGYKIVPMASRTWSAGLVFSKANEAHFVLFRTHGVDSSFRFEDCFSYDDDGKVRLSGYFRRIKRKDYSDNQESIHNKILTDSRSFVGVSISDSLCPDSEETLFSHYCRKSGGFLPLHDPHLSDLEDDFI